MATVPNEFKIKSNQINENKDSDDDSKFYAFAEKQVNNWYDLIPYD